MELESYALDELTWPEAGRVLSRDPRVLLPVGALEQHGPHLPLGTNTFLAEAVARTVSARMRLLRAPTFPYGVTAGERGSHAGTATLRRKTLHRAINELLASWEDHGVSEIVLITAHRYERHLDALLMALTSRSRTTVIDLHAVDVGDLLEGTPELEHGGELETSLMLHLAPDRVRREEIADHPPSMREARTYIQQRMPTAPPDSRGVLGFPSLATPEKGRAVFERWVGAVMDLLGNPPG